jgi:hypothetical protein
VGLFCVPAQTCTCVRILNPSLFFQPSISMMVPILFGSPVISWGLLWFFIQAVSLGGLCSHFCFKCYTKWA